MNTSVIYARESHDLVPILPRVRFVTTRVLLNDTITTDFGQIIIDISSVRK